MHKKLSYTLFLLTVILFINEATAQEQVGLVRKVVNSVFFDTTATERPKFIAYPTVAYAPETKWEFGISALYSSFHNVR